MIYEVMYIIPSKYSDTEVEGIMGETAKLFEKHGATIEKTQNLGKIKMAYPIKKERYGTYVLVYTEAEGEAIEKIEQELRLSDEVLRHMVLKREKGIPTFEFSLTSYVAPLTSEGKRAYSKPKATEVKTETTDSGEKLKTEDLDKKLDEILDSDIVTDV